MGAFATRLFVWVALLGYSVAFVLQTRGHRLRWARIVWVAGAVAFVLHVVCAFQFFHGWSHAAALADTARQTKELTGFDSGSGLYLNYLFAVTWLVDAAWWLRVGKDRYCRRNPWVTWSLHAFFLFMFINGAIVFGKGPVRWYGGVLVAMMLLTSAHQRVKGRNERTP